ncbi:hypothetical protein CC78DRAFT_344000 [Lojkania enalia]|uniref:Uncharacterized protein n=1 Tax=Lojkania enalia TaxID=147567 RepID=A0A9P4K3V7_9PLEO|nr:hypothetical protein CC78DRAFT_344000 [Didymosphaeria enalia]
MASKGTSQAILFFTYQFKAAQPCPIKYRLASFSQLRSRPGVHHLMTCVRQCDLGRWVSIVTRNAGIARRGPEQSRCALPFKTQAAATRAIPSYHVGSHRAHSLRFQRRSASAHLRQILRAN